MRHLLGRRLLFFGGKGGVGKTTCSAAVALAASRHGRRVLLVSTDPAHSTSDIFERPFGDEEREILPNLAGIEIDAEHESRRYLNEVKRQIGALFSPAVVRDAARQMELAAMMPGLSDVAQFDRIAEIVRTRANAYDLVVFDTAPTGHTLRLLQMPELMEGWLRALGDRRRRSIEAARAAGPQATATGAGALPDPDSAELGAEYPAARTPPDPVLGALERRAAKLAEVRARFTDSSATAFVLVVLAERLPIEETARAAHLLERAALPIGGIVVNRLLPDGLAGAFYEARKAQERRYLEEIERRFGAFVRTHVPQLERDVYGLTQLERVAEHLLG